MARIRRIRKSDCSQDFKTGHREFDKVDLWELYIRDKRQGYQSYVLEVEGEIVAVLCIRPEKDAVHVSRLGVKEGRTGKGYGEKLIRFVLQETERQGKRKITLKAHGAVVGFFERSGFEVTKTYSDPKWGEDCAEMQLLIDY